MKLDNLNFDDIVVPKASSKRDKIDSLMLQGIINMINNAKAEGCYSVLAIQDEFVPKRVLQVEVQWPEGSNGKILAAVKDSFIENTTLDKIYEKIK